MMHVPSLYIATSRLGGRGVFTAELIPAGSVIELCPVIILSNKERKLLHQTLLHDYYFMWGEEEKQCAIVLGYGSLYNHQYDPNARYYFDYDGEQMEIHARRDIPAGSEITVTYNANPEDKSRVWFDKEK